jgi:hypothetical protein
MLAAPKGEARRREILTIEVSRGGVASPDLRIRGTGAGLARLFLGGAAGPGLEVEGRADRLPALTGAFDWTPSS